MNSMDYMETLWKIFKIKFISTINDNYDLLIYLYLKERLSSTIIFFFPSFLSITKHFIILFRCSSSSNCVPFDGAFLELTGRLRAEQKSAFFFTETFRRRFKLQHEIERKLSRKINFIDHYLFFIFFLI